MSFRIEWSRDAEEDLLRLYDHILIRELEREGDLDLAQQAVEAIRHSVNSLKRAPFVYRKVGESPFWRELVIPFARTGYVAIFEIMSETRVVVTAVRHQREDDYH